MSIFKNIFEKRRAEHDWSDCIANLSIELLKLQEKVDALYTRSRLIYHPDSQKAFLVDKNEDI